MPGNVKAVRLYNATSNCINYVGTMDGVFAMGFNWAEIKMLAEVLGIDFTPGIYQQMKVLEAEFTKRFNDKKQSAAKGGNS